MKSYKTAIIGCGRIGTGFDAPESKEILTHAKAYKTLPTTSLMGVFDIDASQAAAAAQKWGCAAYDNLDRMMQKISPDIVSVCVPDRYHYDYLKTLTNYPVKAVIGEKPLTQKLSEAGEIIESYRKNKIPLTVNFSRRFDLYVRQLQQDIAAGVFGKILNARITYTKGILHNGSHAINLVLFLFGNMTGFKVLSATNDYSEQDKTLNIYLSFEKCRDLFLIAGDERCCSIFEVDIMGEKKRSRITGNGLFYEDQIVTDDLLFDGYKEFSVGNSGNTALDQAMPVMVKNVIDNLETGTELYSSGEDALLTQSICNKLEEASAKLN